MAVARMSETLEAQLEGDTRHRIFRIARQQDRPYQLAAVHERVVGEVVIRITMEGGVGGEVQLRDQRLASRRFHHVVHVLRDTIRDSDPASQT